MKPSEQRETQIAAAAIKAISSMWPQLKPIRIQCGRVPVPGGGYMQLAPEGTPDYLIPMPRGRALWMEFKRPGEKPSHEQRRWHLWATKNGHVVVVCENVVDAIRAVKEELSRWS